jgi:hypothetical protein
MPHNKHWLKATCKARISRGVMKVERKMEKENKSYLKLGSQDLRHVTRLNTGIAYSAKPHEDDDVNVVASIQIKIYSSFHCPF